MINVKEEDEKSVKAIETLAEFEKDTCINDIITISTIIRNYMLFSIWY